MTLLYAGTNEGLWIFRLAKDGLTHIATVLSDHAVRDVASVPGDSAAVYVACGYHGWGLHKVSDRGGDVAGLGLDDRWVWGVTSGPNGTLFVGTEPPGVYRSTDDGETLTAAPDIEDLAADANWFFWNEPFEAGHVHGFGVHSDHPERVLAGVEVGGAVHSEDGGETWATIDALNGNDVHNILPNPIDSDQWYAATGEGLFRSDDGGTNWRPMPPLNDKYVARVAFDALNRPCVSAAPDSKANEGSFWRRDGRWKSLHTSPANSLSGMITTHPVDPDVLVHTESSPDRCRLLVSRDGGETWFREGPVLPRVWTLAIA